MTEFSMPVFPGDLGAYADQARDGADVLGFAPRAAARGAHRGGRKQSGRVRKPNRRRDAVAAAAVVALAYGFGALFTAIGCVVR